MISTSDLDTTTVTALDALCKVSNELGLEKSHWSSYQTALTRDTMTLMNLELEQQDLDELSWTITKRKNATEKELKSMNDLLTNMRQQRKQKEENMVKQWQDETAKLKERTRLEDDQYENIMEKTRSRIDDTTITNIELLEKQTLELEKQLEQVKKQLGQYYDMPPDTDLANIKVQEKIDTMTNLEKRRNRLLDEIANSMS